MSNRNKNESPTTNRRSFMKRSTAATVGGALAASLGTARMVHAAEDNTLKVALIGCGGRGTGAAINATNADPNVKITVLADVFPDRIQHCKNNLGPRLRERLAVPDDHCFSGFDAYKNVMMTDADVVILATPPHFRPAHLKACIDAKKHVFCEKPVAVDPTGVRSVLETTKLAKEKDLSIVSGLCWRYDLAVKETMARIKDGAIGDIKSIQENYLTGALWHRGNDPNWSEMEYQIRNWLYYTWLSGDHIVEQHIHSLDKAMWLMDDQPPAKCFGLGGREVRTDEKWGNIFDHFAVCYEWANGVKTYAYTRQMKGCANEVDDFVVGTKGSACILGTRGRPRIVNKDGEWKYEGNKPSMYDVEHKEMFAGIRKGQHINNGVYMSHSTLLAIMGREACYTGQVIEWHEAMKSQQKLGPAKYEFGDNEVRGVAVPGITKFA